MRSRRHLSRRNSCASLSCSSYLGWRSLFRQPTRFPSWLGVSEFPVPVSSRFWLPRAERRLTSRLSPQSSVGWMRSADQSQKPSLIKHRDAEFAGLVELTAGLFAGDDIVGLF